MSDNKLWRKFIANISRENAPSAWGSLAVSGVAGGLTGGYVDSLGTTIAIVGISCLAGGVVMVGVAALQTRWGRARP